ncbi:MAG: cell envelope integrity protein CreD [Chitinispirillales bacterium]|nr:cell envelope integrity protein CreD [Chitinispirillales bacterium]
METIKTKITQSLTFKGITIAVLIMLLLIPGTMIQSLIKERQERSREAIQLINERWSLSQTLCAPLLLIPYTTTRLDTDQNPHSVANMLYVTPKELKINVSLMPEERYYGIYRAILYRSEIHFEGKFSGLADLAIENSVFHFDKAQIAIGITDLKGVTQNPDFRIDGKALEADVGAISLFSVSGDHGEQISTGSRSSNRELTRNIPGKTLVVDLKNLNLSADSLPQTLGFNGTMRLNGSSSLNFIPLGQSTEVTVNGQWPSPSFIGSFSPESEIDSRQFSATWNVLSFNREIPATWSHGTTVNLRNSSFGVNLIRTVDHYQQNMRSAKYALMFIALTFVVFFFAEIFTKKPILFFQYILVGIALILFYSLLLSFSEQVGFGWAYLIASAATVLMITVYFNSLIRQAAATLILGGIMITLYTFLYVILQIQDFALLFGSIFLFIILGIIMFVSNKIKLGKAEAAPKSEVKQPVT